jgi:hypothetical protein
MLSQFEMLGFQRFGEIQPKLKIPINLNQGERGRIPLGNCGSKSTEKNFRFGELWIGIWEKERGETPASSSSVSWRGNCEQVWVVGWAGQNPKRSIAPM